ncbi:MAG: hypothetical protein WBX15_10605 [Thermoanaerobaculia bacterium]
MSGPRLLRTDLSDERVLIAPDRGARPHAFLAGASRRRETNPVDCPFCPGNEEQTPPETLRVGAPDWRVRVFPNKYPMFVTGTAGNGGRDGTPAEGAHEVIVETRDHLAALAFLDAGHWRDIVTTYRDRYRVLASLEGVSCVQLFKNAGTAAGESIDHPHSQIIAMGIVPPNLGRMAARFESAAAAGDGCPLCGILSRSEYSIVEDDGFVWMVPPVPRLPFEQWIVPRRHHGNPAGIEDFEIPLLARLLGTMLDATDLALGEPPFNWYWYAAPKGSASGTFHWYLSMQPRLTGLGGFELSTGIYVNVVAPETAATRLRNSMDRSKTLRSL